jgi:hypothetical protein
MTSVKLATHRVPEDRASPALHGGIRCGVRGVLRVMIWCVITSISPLDVVVLRPGPASLDSGDLAYSGLHDLVRGLHGD